MSAAMPLHEDFSADDLRWLARASRDGGQIRRLLALATIYEGSSRMEAARTGAVGLQTVRDWVRAFNTTGSAGLIDRKAPGQKPKLDAAQRQALAQVTEEGPDTERHGVVRWRPKDLAAWVYASFGVSLDESTLGRTLKPDGLCQAVGTPAPPRAGCSRLGGIQKSLPATVSAIRAGLPPGTAIELWWQD